MIFDIGGALELTPPTGWGLRWETALGLPAGGLDEIMGDVWAAGAVGGVTERQVEQAAAERLGLGPDQLEAFFHDLWEEYLGTANDELIAYIKTLAGRCRLGIVSNSFVGATEREEMRYGFSALVEDIVYSHEVGLEKPDPAIYALACERLGLPPGKCLFVDNAAVCVDGAERAGLSAVLFEDTADTIAAIERFLS